MSESVLEEGLRIVRNSRKSQYGHPRDNLRHTAELWAAYLGVPVTNEDVSMMMVLLKISRQKIGERKRDNLVDMAGYVQTIEEMDPDLYAGS